jgi:hypothetical protein
MPFIVMVRTATGPRSRNGGDRYAAVVELDPAWMAEHPGQQPKMISNRAKGVRRVVRHTGPLHARHKNPRSPEACARSRRCAPSSTASNGTRTARTRSVSRRSWRRTTSSCGAI